MRRFTPGSVMKAPEEPPGVERRAVFEGGMAVSWRFGHRACPGPQRCPAAVVDVNEVT
jgi:hypothetical protein